MNPLPRLQVYGIVFLLLLLSIFSGCTSGYHPRMFRSDYSYEISITHFGPLSNATFVIPLPVKDNYPKLASEIYSRPDFGSRDNVTVSLTRTPAWLNMSDASQLSGYDPWFLVITTLSPVSDSSPYEIYNFRTDIHKNLDTPDFLVNTARPIGNETLVTPKFNFSWQNPFLTEKRSWSRIEYLSDPISYTTKIFSDFDAPSSTSVSVFCKVYGHNGWLENYDAWVGNYYSDQYSVTVNGNTSGWYDTNGKLSIAKGVYRPEWQNVLNATTPR